MADSYRVKSERTLAFEDDVAHAALLIRRMEVRVANIVKGEISARHRAALQRGERVTVRFSEDEIADLIRERLDKTLRIS